MATLYQSLALMLPRIDACPVQEDDLTRELKMWLSVLVDTINSDLEIIETDLNSFASPRGLTAPSHTTVEITALAMDAPNGSFWYDTDTNNIKAKSNGVVVIIA